ncbi:MAG: pseudouridine synthase [Lachnospiraceae bacterium]|nr:pseudouridine synthase [Lachnospiraceae bacterium]
MRINRYIAACGVTSRRGADRLIAEGRVALNGSKALVGDEVKEGDEVRVDGKIVTLVAKTVVLAYNKPVGVTCSMVSQGEDDVNISDAVGYGERVFPVGRLDKDSRGLILLTNDGELADFIMRAHRGHEKEYEVRVDKKIDEAFLKAMSEGVPIELEERDYITAPCSVRPLTKDSFSIVLTEGKNRQIRRMCKALGREVTDLVRVRVMHIKLDDLPEGSFRELSDAEISGFKGEKNEQKTGSITYP